MTKLSFVIVTFNSDSTIGLCISSILKQKKRNFEIIVVDNNSTDNTLSKISAFEELIVIRSKKNLGYNGGNNLGIKSASGNIIVIMNPDTEIPSDFTKKVTDTLDAKKDIAILGFKILNKDGSLQRTGNTFPSLRSLWYENSAYHDVFPNSKAFKKYIISNWDRSTSTVIDAVSGACVAIRRDFIDSINGLDGRFFLFFEEFDLGHRVIEKGYSTYFNSEICVTHIGGVSTNQEDDKLMTAIYKKSQSHYILKNRGKLFYLFFLLGNKLFNIIGKVIIRIRPHHLNLEV